MSPKLLTEDEVSKWLGLSVYTLRTMRSRPGKDPIPFTKIGRQIKYREDLVKKWIDRNTFHDTAESKDHRSTG
jgi:hypothetical protein